MDVRKTLPPGIVLSFPGMPCTLGMEVGRGSNAIVYRGEYPDALSRNEKHTVLVKELFPFHPKGAVYRDDQGNVTCREDGLAAWTLHRQSFEYGNRIHLRMLEKYPDLAGANLNTFSLNGTLYTVLGYTGGRDLGREYTSPAGDLRRLAARMMKLLDALDAFHSAGYLHLDIAPDNVLIIGEGDGERVMLIDYNSVHILSAVQGEPEGSLSIKAGYTAPEVRTGKTANITEAADLFSVAAIFYRCISGAALTPFQMARPVPPEVSSSAALRDLPDTVQAMAREILRKGLATLPVKRYSSVSEMREAFRELIDRIDGVGVTHWALWEAGRKNVLRAIRENPAFAYVTNEEELYPANVILEDGSAVSTRVYIDGMTESVGEHALMLAPGGMGKTTALLRAVYLHGEKYSPSRCAITYISLNHRIGDGADDILDRVLEGLRFKEHTQSFESARHCLRELLDKPLQTSAGERPSLLILLDGLNEVSGPTQGLISGINALSKLRGVRFLITTRSDEPALPFARVRLASLTDEDAGQQLSRRGLLTPESPEMLELIKTPLMLSIFIRSALAEEKQLTVRTRDELMAVYFGTIQSKAVRELPEDAEEKWQIDAAVSLVLPAIAGELSKKQVMSDAELLNVVGRCRKILSSRILRRAFPRWIGHSKAIRGGTESAEEWYGLIVHDLLWKKLGLLIRTEPGGYQIPHQIIREYLVTLDRENLGKVRKRQRVKYGLIAGALVVLLTAGGFIYTQYIRPQPYNDQYAEDVLTAGLGGYVDAAKQYDAIRRLVDCAIETPENYERQLRSYSASTSSAGIGLQNYVPEDLLEKTLATGKVVSWSGRAFDEAHYLALVSLAEERREDYALYVDALTYVMEDARANRLYGGIYPQLLSDLIEADADITAKLYELVCEVHKTGKFADGSAYARAYETTVAGATLQNAHLSEVVGKELYHLEGAREDALRALNSCGALAAYGFQQ